MAMQEAPTAMQEGRDWAQLRWGQRKLGNSQGVAMGETSALPSSPS